MKLLALALMVAGLLALVYGDRAADRPPPALAGRAAVAAPPAPRSMPVTPVAGAVVLVAGMVLMMMPRRRVA